MQKNICNICGGNLINKNGRWVCEACGAYAPEEITAEEISLLYNARQKLRLGNFDDAEEMYADVARQYPTNVEAYWGLLLSQYGIVYEKDYDGKMIPTCYSTSYESLYENKNYKRAYDLGDADQKEYFKNQAEKIEKVRKEWVDIASKEEPYDIFISYKATESDDPNKRTDDYTDAYDLYSELTKLGYKVFFSRVSLQNKTGDRYEPYIFNALNTAKVMIVYSSKLEYVNATWVRNEYLRFDKRIKRGEKLKNSLILVYKNFNPSELSKPLKDIQNINRNDIDFLTKLKDYLSKVMADANKKIAKIDRVEVKAFEPTANKQIKSIKKRKLNNIEVKKDNVEIQKVSTREIGKYSSAKVTPDVEKQLNVAFQFLEKSLFSEALGFFERILINNKTNSKALFGKLLALEKSRNIGELFNKDFTKFTNFDLLYQVIEYSEKGYAEQYLSNLIDIIFKLIDVNQYKVSGEIYSHICDYDIEVIQKSHVTLVSKVIEKNVYNEDAFLIIDTALKFLVANKKNYSKVVCQLIIALLKFQDNDKANKYFNEASPILYDDINFIQCEFCMQANKSSFNDAIYFYITSRKDYLEEKINGISQKNADRILSLFSNYIIKNFIVLTSNELFDNVKENIELIAGYDFIGSEDFINSLCDLIINNPNEIYNDLFEYLIPSQYGKDLNEFNKKVIAYANGFLANSDFINARKYVNFGLTYDQENIDLLKLQLQISIEATNANVVWKNIYKLNDFDLFNKILFCLKDEEEMVAYLTEKCNECTKYINDKELNADPRIYIVFDKIIQFFPEAYNSNLLTVLENFADKCKKIKSFENAEKYYSMMTGIDSNQYKAYWGLVQVKLKCTNNDELIHQYTLITSIPEFNSALFAASSNTEAVNEFIDCRVQQESWIKSEKEKKERAEKEIAARKKLAKRRGITAIVISSIIVLAITISLLTVKVFIPTKKYNDSIALINDGNYSEAFKTLETIEEGFKDREKQMLICKSGQEFLKHEFQTGIDYFVKAGGTVNVNYNAQGGTGCKTTEKITKNTIIDNDPSKYGYTFEKWNLSSYKIVTAYNSYECTVNLYASYNINKYSIYYNLDGGTCSNLLTNYNVETSDYKLPYPTKVGYTFIGWSGTDISGTQKDVTIKKGSIGNRNYTANYRANTYDITLDYVDGRTKKLRITYDSTYSLETPTRTGYDFKYWQYGTTKVDISGTWKIADNATLTAVWSAINYTISYDLNGGENSPYNPSSYTIETSTFTLQEPTKDYYTFIGWSGTDIEGTTKEVTIEKGSIGNREYVANFKGNEFKITYDYGYDNKTKEFTVTYGSEYSLETPTRTGYNFSYWRYNDTIVSNSGYWNIPENATLTAVWSAKGYNITYDLNGGTNSVYNPSTYTIETPTFTLQEPTKQYYTFTGWSGTDIRGISKTVTIKKGSTGDRKYTANYTGNKYDVIYDLGYDNKTIKDQATYGSWFILDKPTRDGYKFTKWTYNGADFDSQVWKYTSSITLKAVWEVINYTITYDLNGGSYYYSNNNPTTYTVEKEATIYSYPNLNGYTFAGWSGTDIDGEYEKQITIPKGSFGDRSYTAHYTNDIQLYDSSTKLDTIKVEYKAKYELPTPTKEGYEFDSWYYSTSGYTVDVPSTGTWEYDGNIYKLYARWFNKYNITYNLDGGTVSTENRTYYTKNTPTFTLNNPTKEGYTFTGWEGTEISGTQFTVTIPTNSEGARSYVARYTPNTYTVSYDLNGGTWSDGSTTSKTFTATYDQSIGTLLVPTNTQQLWLTFDGWYYGDTKIESNYIWKIPNDVTLKAKWSTPSVDIDIKN